MEKIDFAERVRLDVEVSISLYTHLAEAQELWGAIQNVVREYGAGCVWNLSKVSEYEWNLDMKWEEAPLEVFGKKLREYAEAKENWLLDNDCKCLIGSECEPWDCVEEELVELMKIHAPYNPRIEGGKSFCVMCGEFCESVKE